MSGIGIQGQMLEKRGARAGAPRLGGRAAACESAKAAKLIGRRAVGNTRKWRPWFIASQAERYASLACPTTALQPQRCFAPRRKASLSSDGRQASFSRAPAAEANRAAAGRRSRAATAISHVNWWTTLPKTFGLRGRVD